MHPKKKIHISAMTKGNWAELPQELLHLIAQRLPLQDYTNFGAVCTSWRSVATKNNYNPESTPPWLMTSLYKSTRFFFPFSGPVYSKRCSTQSRFDPAWKSRGWIAKGGISRKLTLFNPLSRTTIELPALEEFPSRPPFSYLGVSAFAISASPSQSADYSVMIGFEDLAYKLQIWAYRSKERAWTRVRVPSANYIIQLIHYKGRFVALDRLFQILTLDDDDDALMVRMQVAGRALKGMPYLIECSGSLLVVCDNWPVFGVVEVDLESKSLKEVKNLGKSSLFLDTLSNACSVDLGIASTGWVIGTVKVKPNCIYVKETHAFHRREFNIWIYHMDDGHAEQVLVKFEEKWATGEWFQSCY